MLTSWRKRLAKESFPLARKRAQTLPTPALYDHAEGAVYYTGQALSAWRQGGGDVALDAAEKNLLVLVEVCRELRARSQ